MYALLFTVVIMGILTGAEIDLYTPSFPELQEVFHLTPFMVELTLTVNLAAHCITALVTGSLGDRYGRKPIIVAGLAIFIVGTLCCIFAPTFWALLLGRFLQGIGISGPAVLSFLVIADNYSVKKQQSLMGTLNGFITLSMAGAPVIGSYVNLYFNWQGNFVVLFTLGILAFVCTLLFVPKDTHKSDVRISIKEYLPVIRSPKAMLYLVTICFLIQPYWIFVGISPLLYMDGLGVSLENFGFFQGSLCMVFALLSISSGLFLKKFGQKNCFRASILLLVLFLIGCTALVLSGTTDPIAITMVLMMLSCGVVFPLNILWPLCLESVKNAKGRIAAVLLSSRLILTSLSIQLVSYFYNGAFFEVGVAMIIMLTLSLLFCYQLFMVHQPIDTDDTMVSEAA